jgi:hypothetical protein
MSNGRTELDKIHKQKDVPASLDQEVEALRGKHYIKGVIIGAEGGLIKVDHFMKLDGKTKYALYDPYTLIYHIDKDISIHFENGIKCICFNGLPYEIEIPPDWTEKPALSLLF